MKKYVLKINGSKLENMKLTEVQEKILQAIVDIAEENHDFTVYIVNQNITDKLNLGSRATVGKVINKLVENNLLIRRSASCYKFNTDYVEFKEVAEKKTDKAFTHNKIDISAAEEFLPVAKWLNDVATSEDVQSYCVAYRTLTSKKNCFSENERLVAKAYLVDKVNKFGLAPVVDRINCSCNRCDLTDLISIISASITLI